MKNRFLIWLLVITIILTQGTTAVAAENISIDPDELLLEEIPEETSEEIKEEITEETLILSEEDVSDVSDELLIEDIEDIGEEPLQQNGDRSPSIYKDDAILPTGYRNDNIVIPVTKSIGMDDASFMEELPSSYQTPLLPALKDQSPYGTCWAFATTALVEINLMKKGIITSPDMSELHLAYFNYNSVVDPLGGTEGDTISYRSSDLLDRGGYFVAALHTLSKWTGVADETTAPYSSAETVLKSGLNTNLAYQDAVHIKNYYVEEVSMSSFRASKNVDDLAVIKKMIMDTGAVGISFGAISRTSDATTKKIYNEANNCFYNPNATEINHSVVVVGWDDNFSKNNFSTAPPGNGAFLVRNSWYTEKFAEYSYRGYFWMSYYEPSLEDYFYSVDAVLSDDYENNYQYDGFSNYVGVYGYIGSNVFTAHADGADNGEVLKAVSFYTTAEQSRYTIEVYTGVKGAPNTGTKVASATTAGTTVYPGYHTVDLKNEVKLEKGTKFAIVISLANGLLGFDGNFTGAYYKSTAKSGQSYLYDGFSWRDVAGSGNFRIKAYTDNYVAPKPKLSGITVSMTSAGNGVYNCSASYDPADYEPTGTLSWSVSDTGIATIDSKGTLTAKKEGDITITASVDGVSGSLTAHVKPATVDVTSVSFTNVTNGSIAMKTGDTFTITTKVLPENATNKTLTWTSSNSSVVKVSGGKLTAVAKGTATVTAKSNNGKTCSAKVTVKQKLTSVTVLKGTKTDSSTGNDVVYCYVEYDPSDYTPEGSIAWSVSDTSIATIDSKGVLTVKKAGEITVTATVDGVSGKLTTSVAPPPVLAESITFSNVTNGRINLLTGESFQVNAVVLPENTTDKSLTWTTSNVYVAKVSGGKITGVTRGTATVRAYTSNGIVGAIRVTVKQKLYGITVVKDTKTDEETGEEITYCYVKYNPSDYPPEGKVSWSVSDTSIATIDADGVLTIKKAGDVTITATVDGVTGSLETHLEPPRIEAESVTFPNVSGGKLTLLTGDSFQVEAKVLPENSTDKTLTWTTSNVYVAKVNNGKITGVTRGTATIRAITAEGVTGAIKVTVKQKLKGISIVMDKKTDSASGEEVTYCYVKYDPTDYPPEGKVSWSISDESIAAIDEEGILDIKKEGDVTISASVDGKSATLNAHVAPPTVDAESIAFTGSYASKTSIELKSGDFVTLAVKILPEDTTDKTVTWSSSNTAVAKVVNGKVTAISKGTAVIKATTHNGHYCSITVTVKQKLLGINIFKATKKDASTGKDVTYFYVEYDPEDYEPEGKVSWSVSDTSIATIDSNGVITVKKAGDITITASVDGKSASLETSVAPPVVEAASVSFTNVTDGKLELKTGDTFTLTAKVLPENTTNKSLTWSSSNTAVVKVSGGVLTAVSAGTANITAKCSNNVSCTVKVTVKQKLLGITLVQGKKTDKTTSAEIIYYSVKYDPADYKPEGSVVWKVSDESVATINSNGEITIVNGGDVTVTATVDGVSASVLAHFDPPAPEEGGDEGGDDDNDDDHPIINDTDWGDISPEERSSFFKNDITLVPEGVWYVVSGEMHETSGTAGLYGVYDGAAHTFNDEIRVYASVKKLTEKTDYSLSYANNVAAGTPDSSRAPSVTVRATGIYSGSATFKFTISPADMDAAEITSEKVVTVKATARTRLSTIKPTVSYNGKKLTQGTDYVLSYYDGSGSLISNPSMVIMSVPNETYTVRVEGKEGGNFTGTMSDSVQVCVINPKKVIQASQLTVTDAKGKAVKVAYTGSDIDFAGLFDNTGGKTPVAYVKYGKTVLTYLKDYKVDVISPDRRSCGKHSVVITCIEADEASLQPGECTYAGTKTVSIEVTGTSITKASIVGLLTSVEYPGATMEVEDLFNKSDKKLKDGWDSVTLCMTDPETKEKIALTPGENADYTVDISYSGKLGKAKVTFTGKGKYQGSITKTVTVKAYNIKKDKEDKFTITAENATYSKKGAIPAVTVTYGDTVLKKGTDYTISYKNNKKVAGIYSGKSAPTVVIKGKGKFTGTDSTAFTVEKADVQSIDIIVKDIAYKKNGSKGYFLQTPKLTESGKSLSYGGNKDIYPVKKSDYVFTYMDSVTLLDGTTRYSGEQVVSTDRLPAGTRIKVSVDVTCGPSSPYTVRSSSQLEATYKVVEAQKNLSKCKVSLRNSGSFTKGNVDSLVYDKSQYMISYKYKGKTIVLEDNNFEVVNHKYDEKTGATTVYLEGGDYYGGKKNFSFKVK